jgi:hypothetical protein
MNNNFGSIDIIMINELAHVVLSFFNLINRIFVSHEFLQFDFQPYNE